MTNFHTKFESILLSSLGSAPSVGVASLNTPGTGETSDNIKNEKQSSMSPQKKFQRYFPQVDPEEIVLNYYSCALVGDMLLQGRLYITKNYFAFYSNMLVYVTKLLIPTKSVIRITKKNFARIIPNGVGVYTRDERRFIFGSLHSRDSTYKLMMYVWKAATTPEQVEPSNNCDLQTSEVDQEASENSPEDSSSAGDDQPDAPLSLVRTESEDNITNEGAAGGTPRYWRVLLAALSVFCAMTATMFAYKLYHATYHTQQEELTPLSGEELFSELVQLRARQHGRAAKELHAFLTPNLLLLTKVRQSLEALSGVMLSDAVQTSIGDINIDQPNETGK